MKRFLVANTVVGLVIILIALFSLSGGAVAHTKVHPDDLRFCSGHNICQGDIYCPGSQVPIVFGRWRGDGKIVPSADNPKYQHHWYNNTLQTHSMLAFHESDHNYWWTVNATNPPDPNYWLDVDISTDAVCYQF